MVLSKATDKGNVCSALAACDLLKRFHLNYLVLLGIAAGFPDEVEQGDVVIGDPIIGYEYSKINEDSTDNEPRTFRSPQRPIQSFIMENSALSIPNKLDKSSSNMLVGPIASGNKGVASSRFRDNLIQLHRHISALEMEAEGIAQAVYNTDKKFFVIKEISDFADKETAGKRMHLYDPWKEYAAEASVEIFFQFLTHCKVKKILTPRVHEKQPT